MALPAPDTSKVPAGENLFPLVPQYVFSEQMTFRTIITDFESGKEQRYRRWNREKMVYTIDLGVMDLTDANTLMDFYKARGGPAEDFLFAPFNERPITGEALGQATAGGALTATTAMKNIQTTTVTVYADGNTATDDGSGNLAGDFSGTIDYVTGVVSITGAPSSASVTIDYSFFRRVRFLEDNFERAMYGYNIYRTRVGLVEVL